MKWKMIALLLAGLASSTLAATLQDIKAEITADPAYKNLTQEQWLAKIQMRDLTRRSQKDFDTWKEMYPRKITAIEERLAAPREITVALRDADGKLRSDAEILAEMKVEEQWLLDKRDRLLDKLAAVLQEESYRRDEVVVRDPASIHNAADYYIDYDNGNDANDGLSPEEAWKTITQYTTTTVRVPGDRAFLRAGITWDQGTEATDIVMDEDGDVDDYIAIIGCDATTNDPWGDADDTKPIIDFEDANYEIKIDSDRYWWLERLDVQNSADTSGAIYVTNTDGTYLKACDVSGGTSDAVEGIACATDSGITRIEGCAFSGTFGNAIQALYGARADVNNCIIDAGAVATLTGVYATLGGGIHVTNSSLAPSNAFATASVRATFGGFVYLRNVTFGTETYSLSGTSTIFSEDNDGTFESHYYWDSYGTISRATTSPRSGGADSYAIMVPTGYCGPLAPLRLGDPLNGFAQLWLEAGSYTVTAYARVGTAWDSALDADEFSFTASYLSSADTADRTEVTSSEQIANDTTWTAFTMAVTPARDGYVYVSADVKEYEDASEEVWVDIEPVVAGHNAYGGWVGGQPQIVIESDGTGGTVRHGLSGGFF